MYEYKFVKIDVAGFINLSPVEDYRDIIQDYAKEGWRLVQVFAPPIGRHGIAMFYELIFEREKK